MNDASLEVLSEWRGVGSRLAGGINNKVIPINIDRVHTDGCALLEIANQTWLVDHENSCPCDCPLQLCQQVWRVVEPVRKGVKARTKDEPIEMLVNSVAARMNAARNSAFHIVEVDLMFAVRLEQTIDVASCKSGPGDCNLHAATSALVEGLRWWAGVSWPITLLRRAGLPWWRCSLTALAAVVCRPGAIVQPTLPGGGTSCNALNFIPQRWATRAAPGTLQIFHWAQGDTPVALSKDDDILAAVAAG